MSTYIVTNGADAGAGSLRQAIIEANAAGGSNTIQFSPGIFLITLQSALPILSSSITIDGSAGSGAHVTIDGTGHRIFFAGDGGAISVDLEHLTLKNGLAHGGDGGGGGGGGLGAGGALFVNAGVDATVEDVQFVANQAVGGDGGVGERGGGGGLGGNGGSPIVDGGAGGGGGGFSGNGGAGGPPAYPNGGGGGGGLNGDGGDGSDTRGGAGNSGGGDGGFGGIGSPGAQFGGGGGGGDGYGGAGGEFGGGGGSPYAVGGAGGFGGGGGFGNNVPGSGGFGGGGGGGENSNGGSGGEGGGGGGVFGNGALDPASGGGGAGLGGAVFVRDGGSLTIVDSGFSGGAVTGGGAGQGAQAGSATGTALFLGADVTYKITSGVLTLTDTIGGIGGTHDSDGGLIKTGAGTLVLAGANTYTGATAIYGGALQVDGSLASAGVTVAAGGVLDGAGSMHAVLVQSGGTLTAGEDAAAGELHTGDVAMTSGAVVAIELGGTGAGQSDRIDVTGTVNLANATLHATNLAGFTAANGDSFVILSNDGTDAVSGTFSGLAEGAHLAAGGIDYTISYQAGDGNDVALTAHIASAPPAASLSATSDSGVLGDHITADNTPTLVGTADPGNTVNIYDTDGTTLIGTGVADGAGDWTITVSALGDGPHTLYVAQVDIANNVSPLSSGLALGIDTTAPTTTVSSVALSSDTGPGETDFATKIAVQTISGALSAPLAADESVQVSLDNGSTWTTATATTGGTAWSVDATLSGSDMLRARVVDVAGNDGTAFTHAYVLDTTAPTVTVAGVSFSADTGVSGTDFVTNTAAQTITGTLSSSLAPSEFVEVSLDDGASWTAATASGTSWSLDAVLPGSGTLKVRVSDIAGNTGPTVLQAYALDTTAPTVSITTDHASLKIGETTTVSFAFSEAVSGFTNADLTVPHGTLSTVTSSDGGVHWTATYTPDDGVAAATNVITLAAGGVTDLAGNANGQASSGDFAIDTVRPTAVIALDDTALTAGETSHVTITFSEAVTGFTTADLTAPHGTLSGLSSSDGGLTWTATFTPDAGVSAASDHITLDNTGVQDAAGNAGVGTTVSADYSIDTVELPPPPPPPPSVVIVTTPTGSIVTGDATDNVIIHSGSGADTVSAGGGSDTVGGGALNDVLQGNTGDDTVAGGAGQDLVYGGQGNDTVQGNTGDDMVFGDRGDDHVLGGQGADSVQGGEGDDYVSGDIGNDVVRGGQGADHVLGGDGDDYVSGDLGDDTVTGGAGADTFHSFAGAGLDLVTDFNRAEGDRVLLDPGTAYTLQQEGADLHIVMAGGEVVLQNVQLSSLSGDWIVA